MDYEVVLELSRRSLVRIYDAPSVRIATERAKRICHDDDHVDVDLDIDHTVKVVSVTEREDDRV